MDDRPVTRAGLIVNPRSGKSSGKGLALAEKLNGDASVSVKLLDRWDQLSPFIDEFAADGVSDLFISSGDGTIQAIQTELAERKPFAQLPRLRGAKWIAVGRLDVNTGGLLLFTTSGDLANRLMHPRYEVEREYAVRVMGVLSKAQAQKLLQGIEMEDGLGKFEHIEDRGGEGSNHWYHVVLKEGRNREVRRIFQAVNLMVSRLIRVRYGAITLPPRIKRGQMLELEPAQVQALLKMVSITGTEAEEQEPVVAKRPARAAPREASGKPQRAPRAAKREPGAKPPRATRPASMGRGPQKR